MSDDEMYFTDPIIASYLRELQETIREIKVGLATRSYAHVMFGLGGTYGISEKIYARNNAILLNRSQDDEGPQTQTP